ncbi:MAG TPA: bifunctional hydroxymethylpyrimidine kinase/phosphomethylpyrimidine kinase, partial [Solirubrobacteraceae bacterium]|nr:bifunctional hydroxymethylpyrimidine kinase/phosphomethylpyrimidine kinase [Solirubrobacteraceae bacterium]
PDGAAHGSGCTHSSTLAARLALGDDPVTAALAAKEAAAGAVRDGLRELGRGAGPVDVLGLRHRSVPAGGEPPGATTPGLPATSAPGSARTVENRTHALP